MRTVVVDVANNAYNFAPGVGRAFPDPFAQCGARVTHISLARFSETMATWRFSYRSVQVKSRPAIKGVPVVLKNPGET